jgi:DNA polymerase III subunit delta'
MNWDLLGHEWAVELLQDQVARSEIRHAYLFTGPQGVGRRTLAIRLAQALNCPQPLAPGVACLECRTCQQIERMEHPDLAIVAADQVGGTLKVDQVRELQHSLSLAPYVARYRVAILLRFEEAHISAANALLKTLEEPPQPVVLILTAESAETLLPTIVSRCEVLRLRPLSLKQVSQGLQERWGISAEDSRLLAHIAAGRPGYALRFHQNPELLEQRKAWLEDHTRLLGASRVERFAYAEAIAKDRGVLSSALQVWISLWRDVMIQASGAAAPIANLDRSEEIGYLAERFGLDGARQTVAVLSRTLDLLGRNANTRLASEVLMLDLPLSSDERS